MDRPAHEIDEIHLPLPILPEAHEAQLRIGQLLVIGDRFSVVAERPDSARVVIAVDECAFQLRESASMINIAGCDRAEVVVAMFDDGCDEGSRPLFAIGAKGMSPFHHAPAVVASLLDQVNHLPQILPDFPSPQSTGGGVEAELPQLAKTVGINLRTCTGRVHEWVVAGNGIRAIVFGSIDVDSQQGGADVTNVLPRSQLIGDSAAITRRKIQIPVGTESQTSAVVSPEWPGEDRLLRIHCRTWRILLCDREAGDAAAIDCGVFRVESRHRKDVAVLQKVGMKRQPVNRAARVDQQIFGGRLPIILERIDFSMSFDDR